MLVTLGEMPARAAAAFGDRPAVIFEDVPYSFDALDRRANRFANALVAAGIEPGDRVTLCAPNTFDWMAAYYGTAKAGAVLNPVTAMLTAGEIGYIAGNCGAKLLLAGPGKGEALFEALAETAVEQVVFAADEAPAGAVTYEEFIANMPDEFEARPRGLDELGAIGYTSGTTGHPKGAMMSGRAIAVGTAGTALMHGRTAADTTVSALPLSHVYGMVVMNCALLCGTTMVLLERFEAEAMLRSVERYRATMLEAVPTGFMYMLADPAMGKYDLSSLERMTTGGQTIPPATAAEVEEKFGATLLELWGMTELAGPGTTHASACERRLGSIGVAIPYVEARIGALEDSRQTAPVGEPGELLIRGPIVPMGYYGNETATKEAFDEDGWFRTGDVATRDEDGFLWVVDRKKDMINTAGFNVYPAELERVLAAHPDVSMAAVGGVPDREKGELAKAYIVPRPGAEPTVDSIVAHCRKHLAPYKVPRQIQFVPDLPVNSTGKILRRELHTIDDGA
ncbi:MAG: AMP-binding protein [Alphaproteobacteria bacterium]|nr:AMP-binding protein [Alphaproteobacteria bacterium]